MKVIEHCIVKVTPGKMGEYLKLEEHYDAVASRLGRPLRKRFIRICGENMHTFIYDTEWDSLEEKESYVEIQFTDGEAREVIGKCEEVTESHEVELYMPCPREEIHKFAGASLHVKF